MARGAARALCLPEERVNAFFGVFGGAFRLVASGAPALSLMPGSAAGHAGARGAMGVAGRCFRAVGRRRGARGPGGNRGESA